MGGTEKWGGDAKVLKRGAKLDQGVGALKKGVTGTPRNKSKKVELWEPQSGIWVGKLTIWVRSFEIQELKQSVDGKWYIPRTISFVIFNCML